MLTVELVQRVMISTLGLLSDSQPIELLIGHYFKFKMYECVHGQYKAVKNVLEFVNLKVSTKTQKEIIQSCFILANPLAIEANEFNI